MTPSRSFITSSANRVALATCSSSESSGYERIIEGRRLAATEARFPKAWLLRISSWSAACCSAVRPSLDLGLDIILVLKWTFGQDGDETIPFHAEMLGLFRFLVVPKVFPTAFFAYFFRFFLCHGKLRLLKYA